ncbi:hypothetical protein CSO01_18570 [Cellulomonas soli]|uniref:Uncharacterized protein n=1 Tax=Cellulomonas soli TaxID=931535 RepID=A0A512PDE5_9CELL|nr:hypothetical protein [Cellulomonas soli]GEP69142.1 hypothetical protein CSO01_18570 [Cellulomonas soli]
MCCVIGSVLFIAIAWCTRTFRVRVLGRQPAAPERWRLGVEDGTGATRRARSATADDERSRPTSGAILGDREDEPAASR